VPTALIIGHKGQDGTYLAQLLGEKGYSITGVARGSVERDGNGGCSGHPVDVTNGAAMRRLVAEVHPDEIYYLAAFHHSSEDLRIDDHELISTSLAVNTLGLSNVLGAVVSDSPASRVFYAGSSRMFGDPTTPFQNEETPLRPNCAYGISKTAGMEICHYYRRLRNVFAASGILYNHESPLRSPRFISRKIVRAAVSIARGSTDKLVVGNLNAKVDWGYAPDYTRAMWQILQLDHPSDFVIGTGILHSVRDFVQAAFGALGLDWKEHVLENSAFLNRESPKSTPCADSSKLRTLVGWKPEVDFQQMIRIMIDAEKESTVARSASPKPWEH
jgi:GDPmannose 4,6-dehydratase